MYMILRYGTGRLVEAVLLHATRERMKVAVRGQEDTVQFSLIGDLWISDDGSEIEIESIVNYDPANTAKILSEPARLLTACAVS